MQFTSYSFIAFLAILFAAYFLSPKRWQWVTLLVGSYVFYAFAGLDCLVFILFTTLSSYVISRLMESALKRENDYVAANRDAMSKEERKAYRARAKKKRFHILLWGLVLNFGILAVLKYTGFAVYNINSVVSLFGGKGFSIPSLLLPMGISFYTFQTMGYLIDVYRAKVTPERNIAKLALFVSFFPQLVQGPISRFGDLGAQLTAPHKFNGKTFTFGLQRILWGYFKKLVIADRVLTAMTTMLDDPAGYDGAYVLLLIIVYSIQIYADFTGGIDITIGIAEAMGIKLTENFDHPFSSKSTKEYWRRWHITMGSWFRDYIFMPISVTRPMMKLNKAMAGKFGRVAASKTVAYIASGVTWFVTGLWHGAAWNFIVWGMLNCLVIIVSEALEPAYKKFHDRFPKLTASAVYGKFMSVRTFLLMGVIRSLDCYGDVGLTFRLWGSMLTFKGFGAIVTGGIFDLGLTAADWLIVLCGIAVVYFVSRASARASVRERLYDRPIMSAALCGLMFIAIIMLGAYGFGYDASGFIYGDRF
ncbi:MAG: MBOAT family protein [Clostridia bacterium]|nr:MBOAT family protein [Clostridia bacterium]